MAFTESLTPFFADFGVDATLAGSPVRAIVNTQTVSDLGVLTANPSADLPTSSAAGAAPGQAFVASAVTYTVRAVEAQGPDGAVTRLTLARA